MKALLFTIGLALIFGAAGTDDLGAITGTQIAVQVLVGFGCMALSALCKGKEDA